MNRVNIQANIEAYRNKISETPDQVSKTDGEMYLKNTHLFGSCNADRRHNKLLAESDQCMRETLKNNKWYTE